MKKPEFIKFEIPSPLNEKDLKGNNEKNILVVLNEELETLLSSKDHLLAKILSAVNIRFTEDIHLLFLDSNDSISIAQNLNKQSVKTILGFGIQPAQLGFNLPFVKYYPIRLSESTLLISDPLSDIASNKQLKKELWNALQIIFPKD